ncbi:MAG: hypothetical protein M0C28_01670 [Candidatus Moduliflexus flocculans]|nr:hypothetical protein [Candidatus Moduliflexus flocculans]
MRRILKALGLKEDFRLRKAPDRPAEEPPDRLHRRDGGREFPRARGGAARDRQVRPGPEGPADGVHHPELHRVVGRPGETGGSD